MDSAQPPGRRAAGVRRTEAAIVAAGRKRLVEGGYANLSLEQVADDAGVTRVTIYRRFGAKLGLLDAIAEDLAARADVVAEVEHALADPDPAGAFRALVAALCRFWHTDPELLRRLVSLSAVDPTAQRAIDEREQWRYDRIAAALDRLAGAGLLRAPFDRRGALAVVGAVTGFPSCAEIAGRMGVPIAGLDATLLRLLGAVVRLD